MDGQRGPGTAHAGGHVVISLCGGAPPPDDADRPRLEEIERQLEHAHGKPGAGVPAAGLTTRTTVDATVRRHVHHDRDRYTALDSANDGPAPVTVSPPMWWSNANEAAAVREVTSSLVKMLLR